MKILRLTIYDLRFMILFFAFIFQSCEQEYTPKPRGFQRIELPKKEYKQFETDCGFSFSIPIYSTMKLDDYPGAEKCWYNLNYDPFNATLHLSYKSINSKADLLKMTEDSRTMVYKHTIKADEIYETLISNKYIHGMLYELTGNTATNFQFYVPASQSARRLYRQRFWHSRLDNRPRLPRLAGRYLGTARSAVSGRQGYPPE